MTPALRAGAEKASRPWRILALMRIASVRLSGEIPEHFAIKAPVPSRDGV